MQRPWSDLAWTKPHPAPTACHPTLLRRAPLSIARHLPTPPPAGEMYVPTHLALFRTPHGLSCEPAYSHALAVPPVGTFPAAAAHTAEPNPYGSPTPDPEVMGLVAPSRPEGYAGMSAWERKQVDFYIAGQTKFIKAQKKAEVARAKKAAQAEKIAERQREKKRKEEIKAEMKRWKARMKEKPRLQQPTQQAEPDPPAFWHPSPCDGQGHRRPIETGYGWPLMSRTMTQAVHDFDYEDRLIRTANGQIVGFL